MRDLTCLVPPRRGADDSWTPADAYLSRRELLVGASAVRAADYSSSGDVAGAVVDTLKRVDVNELRACA